jgi:hypothetical protein
VATNFDPFRLDQRPAPEPVDGPLPPPLMLVDEDDDLDTTRPSWHRNLSLVVIAMFLGTSVLTMIRQIVQLAPETATEP